MSEIEDDEAALVIASPPFSHRTDGTELDKGEYLAFMGRVLAECTRLLRPGGVLVTVNTDLRDRARYNGGDSSFEGSIWHKHADVRRTAEQAGLRCVDTKIWAKSLNRNMYRYTYSYIQFFGKPESNRVVSVRHQVVDGFGADVWLLTGGTQRRGSDGRVFRDAIHPEIAARCIEQLSRPGDLVVAPFCGSGTVSAVARLMARRSIAYEVDAGLEALIRESLGSPGRFPSYRSLIERFGRPGEGEPEVVGAGSSRVVVG